MDEGNAEMAYSILAVEAVTSGIHDHIESMQELNGRIQIARMHASAVATILMGVSPTGVEYTGDENLMLSGAWSAKMAEMITHIDDLVDINETVTEEFRRVQERLKTTLERDTVRCACGKAAMMVHSTTTNSTLYRFLCAECAMCPVPDCIGPDPMGGELVLAATIPGKIGWAMYCEEHAGDVPQEQAEFLGYLRYNQGYPCWSHLDLPHLAFEPME